MRVERALLEELSEKVFNIGYQGELNHTQVIISCPVMFRDYPDAVASMVVKPPQGDLYPVSLTRDGNDLTWDVSASDVAIPGAGILQLTFTDGEGEEAEIIKTVYGSYSVNASLVANGEAPDPVQSWLDEAGAALSTFETEIGEIRKITTATESDEGLALSPKTVVNGKVTEWEYIDLADPEVVTQAIDDWLDDHPEATTTVEDGAITEAKLNDSLKADLAWQDDVDDVKNAIYKETDNINDEKYEYGGIYNGVPFSGDTRARSKNYIPVSGGMTLKAYAYYGTVSSQIPTLFVTEYDQSKNYLRQGYLYAAPKYTGLDITVGSDTAFIRFNTLDEISGLDIDNLRISIYKSADYVSQYTPHLVVAWSDSVVIPERGIKISNGSYIHFTKCGENLYICREYKNVYVNNLLQLYKMYFGSYVDGDIVKGTDIGTSYSDVIGPISVHRNVVDGYIGAWSGGTHGKTIDNVEYPTATEVSKHIYANGVEVSANGVYTGDVTITTENSLYFPQTVTGADLSQATKAFTERRVYTLTDKMNVKVFLTGEYATGGGITSYMGCQCNTYDMTKIWLPNCEKELSINPSSTYYFDEKEWKYYCSNSSGHHYDVEIKPYGLGDYSKNSGTSEFKYGNVATFNKIYYHLIKDAQFNNDTRLMWEANYDYYID